MKPSNTIVVSTKYIEEKEHQIADLSKKVERLQEQLDELQNENNNLCNDIVDLNLTIENKEKQLNDANKVIKKYSDGTIYLFPTWYNGSRLAEAYLKKWGVK